MHIVFDIDHTVVHTIDGRHVLAKHCRLLVHRKTSKRVGKFHMFLRPYTVEYMKHLISLNHEISLWTRADREYASDVAEWLQDLCDGLKFKYVMSLNDCLFEDGSLLKPLIKIDGDILLDDTLSNEKYNEGKFLLVPKFSCRMTNDRYFIGLIDKQLHQP